MEREDAADVPLLFASDGGTARDVPRRSTAEHKPWNAARVSENLEEDWESRPKVPFSALWQYSTPFEKFLVFLGTVAAGVHGVLLPVWTVVLGETITALGDSDTTAAVDKIAELARWFFMIAVVALVTSFIQVRFLTVVASRTCIRLRELYFRSLMRQDVSWYDGVTSGELTARVSSDIDLIQAGMGQKAASAVQVFSTAVVGLLISLDYTWRLSILMVSTLPVFAVFGANSWALSLYATGAAQRAYSSAGCIASDVISLIRTVHAFSAQEEEAERYEKELKSTYKIGVARGFIRGLGMGLITFLMFCTNALAFYYGARFIRIGEISITGLFVALFSVLMGLIGLGQAGPSFLAFVGARSSAPRIYEVIERTDKIDALDDHGQVPDDVRGDISFQNVSFNYASRADGGLPPVLRNLNLQVRAGTTHALVGPSGCGKSSTVGLIERFYDPQHGSVCLDGADVKTLNVQWLRAQIGYVGQMPTLFHGSIRENIAFGVGVDFGEGDGSHARQAVSDEDIISAAKLANAHSFISELPEGYETKLGEGGALLNRGQKQRICIARAVVCNPKVLLLDEAASELDAQSERIVQNALEKVSAGRSTIVIAHRLNTVRKADVISVFKNGEIAESGSHDELANLTGGVYKELVEVQRISVERDTSGVEIEAGDPDSLVATRSAGPSQSKPRSLRNTGAGEEELEDEKADVDKRVIGKVFAHNASETLFILLGCIGGAVAGASWPLSAVVFSKVTVLLAEPNNSEDMAFWTWRMVDIGAGALIGSVMQMGMLGISGERLTRKLRSQTFQALLRQEVASSTVRRTLSVH